jgi:hypothetical protein
MLAGQKPEDQKAMLDAQKMAAENFEATKKMMTAPPPPPAPVIQPVVVQAPMPNFQPQVMMSSNGKPMPAQPPQPEI